MIQKMGVPLMREERSREDQGLWESHLCRKDVGNSHEIISLVCLPLGFTFHGGHSMMFDGFLAALAVKNPPAEAGTAGRVSSIPGSGRSPGGRNGNPLQGSCLENPMDRGAWWATVHGEYSPQRVRHD